MVSGGFGALGAAVHRLLAGAVIAMAALWAPLALAEGCVWTIPQPFLVYQENGNAVQFDLRLQGTDVIGTASYTEGEGGWAKRIQGGVKGSIADQRFYLRVQWVIPGRSSIGVYVARLENGYPKGALTRDEGLPNPVNSGWTTTTPLFCTGSVAPIPDLQVDRIKPPPRTYIESIGKAPMAFGGRWVTAANGGAWSFDMSFSQNGRHLTGVYTVRETGVTGTVTGFINGATMTLDWTDQGATPYAGEARLRLAPDGASFEGTYKVTYVPPGLSVELREGTWHGQRQ